MRSVVLVQLELGVGDGCDSCPLTYDYDQVSLFWDLLAKVHYYIPLRLSGCLGGREALVTVLCCAFAFLSRRWTQTVGVYQSQSIQAWLAAWRVVPRPPPPPPLSNVFECAMTVVPTGLHSSRPMMCCVVM